MSNKTESLIDEKQQKITESLAKIENKTNKFLFSIPEINTPSALIYEIYFHATTVKKMGYDVIILTEKEGFTPPSYIEEQLTKHTHKPMGGSKLSVGPEDIMVIPEIHSNVMEQTKDLPCLRIGLLQSFDYMLNALVPGTFWNNFGIKNIITTSNTLKDLFLQFTHKDLFDIDVYNIGLPVYFQKSKKPQKPVISIVGRNPNDITKIVKLFYTKYPQYRWVSFDAMLTNSNPPEPLRRTDFADKLKNNFAAVWVDRISSFGTFPLECMKSGVIPICHIPDVIPEYVVETNKDDQKFIKENAGVWTNSYYDIPDYIGDILTRFLDDNIPDELYDSMDKIAKPYTQAQSEKSLKKIYDKHIENRYKTLKNSISQENKKQ